MKVSIDEPVEYVTYEQRAAEGLAKSGPQEYRDEDRGDAPRSVRIGNRKFRIAAEHDVWKQVQKLRRDFPDLGQQLFEWLKSETAADRRPWGVLTAWAIAEVKAGNDPWTREKIKAFLAAQRKGK